MNATTQTVDLFAMLAADLDPADVAARAVADAADLAARRENAVRNARVRNCKRCNGTGRLVQFDHVQGGVCWECNGYSWARSVRG